jgi:hypothetical protein
MKKLALITLLLCGVAAADPAPHKAQRECDPFSSMHSCDRVAQSDQAKESVPPPAAAPAAGAPNAAQLHQTCVDAMNADPDFAKSIVAIADKQIDQKTIKAHEDADFHIQKNERHVFYAYAAMWVIAALFVLFLWMRQSKLLADIASLKRDLEAAAKDSK